MSLLLIMEEEISNGSLLPEVVVVVALIKAIKEAVEVELEVSELEHFLHQSQPDHTL
jgi:hypothetical protein